MSLRRLCCGKAIENLILSFKCSSLEFQKMPFYAVAKGRTTGIFTTWADCEAQVKGFSGARYKKFDTVESAQVFIDSVGGATGAPKSKPSENLKASLASTYNNNLKRSYTTATNSKNFSKQTKNSDSSEDSDNSDDLNTILTKQLDDIENRLKNSAKAVAKSFKDTKHTGRKAIMIDHSEAKKPRIANEANDGFEIDSDGYVQVYTDGACSANGTNSAKAGLGVYWGDGHTLNVSAPVSGRATNNCGEIQAATKAIKIALDNGVQKLSINTDSQFLINSVTKWMSGWKRKGWKLASGEPVKNEKDFKELDSIQDKLYIKWNYVEAHKGIHGNEMADRFAKAGAALYGK